MPSRSALLLAGCLAALCGLVSGCGDEPADGEIILRVANWGGPAIDRNFLELEREIREGFERQHPGVRVRVEQIPGHGQYAPKLIMMHVAGSAPDVVHLDASSAAIFVDNGVLLDLMPLADADPSFSLDLYFDEVVATMRRGERVYGIPLDFTPMVMYYNRTLFDAAGVPYPRDGWTWDEFLDAARKLTIHPPGATRPEQYGLSFENVMPFWVPWLWTNGGDVLNAEGTRATGHFDGPESSEAVRFLVDLIRKEKVAPSLRDRAAMGQDPFLNSKAAMDLKGHWMLIDYRRRKLDVGVVALPTRIDKPATVIYASGLAISSQTQQSKLAWEYIKYMTSEEVQVKRVASGLAISGNRDAAAHYADDPIEQSFIRQIAYARPPLGARVEMYPVCEDLGREMMEDVLESDVPVDKALTEAARLMDAALAR